MDWVQRCLLFYFQTGIKITLRQTKLTVKEVYVPFKKKGVRVVISFLWGVSIKNYVALVDKKRVFKGIFSEIRVRLLSENCSSGQPKRSFGLLDKCAQNWYLDHEELFWDVILMLFCLLLGISIKGEFFLI